MAGFSQLVYRAHDFVRTRLDCDEAVQMDAFPSLKASLYTTFYKFLGPSVRVRMGVECVAVLAFP